MHLTENYLLFLDSWENVTRKPAVSSLAPLACLGITGRHLGFCLYKGLMDLLGESVTDTEWNYKKKKSERLMPSPCSPDWGSLHALCSACAYIISFNLHNHQQEVGPIITNTKNEDTEA